MCRYICCATAANSWRKRIARFIRMHWFPHLSTMVACCSSHLRLLNIWTRCFRKPTTANRYKRLFSTMWNKARGWGYTDLPNPCTGVQGHSLAKRTVYITDDVFNAVRAHASAPLQDALDLAYLTGQ